MFYSNISIFNLYDKLSYNNSNRSRENRQPQSQEKRIQISCTLWKNVGVKSKMFINKIVICYSLLLFCSLF